MLFVLFNPDQVSPNWSLQAPLSYREPPSALFSPSCSSSSRSCGRDRPLVIWLLSRGQKSAVNCAPSSFSGRVPNWSRQRGGIGDLLSSPGITCQRYTGWSHNKLTKHPTPRAHTHPSPKAPWREERRAQLVKGHFSSSVYFPSVNCVIAHGSAQMTARAKPTKWADLHYTVCKSRERELCALSDFIIL